MDDLEKLNSYEIAKKVFDMTPGKEKHKLFGNYLRLVAPNPDEKIITEIEEAIKNANGNQA